MTKDISEAVAAVDETGRKAKLMVHEDQGEDEGMRDNFA